MGAMRFFLEFLKSPVTTGGVLPSSTRLARAMVGGIAWENARTIVELGPGTGAFTSLILEHMPPGAQYLGIEASEPMVALLRERFPLAHFAHESAQNIRALCQEAGITSIDVVVSGLPWAWLPGEERSSIFAAIHDLLSPESHFATFAHLHGLALTGGRRFRKDLESNFSHVDTTPIIWSNVPPSFVYHCRTTEG